MLKTTNTNDTQSETGSSQAPDVLQDALTDPLAEQAKVSGGSSKPKKGLKARFRNGFKAIGRALGRGGDKRRARVREQAQDIPTADIVYEQLAHAGAYGKLDPKKLPAWGYREAQVIDDTASGFRAVLYMPSEKALAGGPDAALSKAIHGGVPAPVLALRGTANKRGVQDDVNKRGVGSYQFRANRQTIAQMLSMAGGKAVVTGHSLGGALAQQVAAHMSGVGRVVTFQAPGINKEDTEKLAKRNAEAAPEDRVMSTHYRQDGDIVHRAGSSHTEGTVSMMHSKGINGPTAHMYYPLARLNEARGGLVPGITGRGQRDAKDNLTRVTHTSTKQSDKTVGRGFHEGGRKVLGGLVRKDNQDAYSTLWDQVKTMHKSGQYTQKRIEAVIQASDKLTLNQKSRMRIQAELLGQ